MQTAVLRRIALLALIGAFVALGCRMRAGLAAPVAKRAVVGPMYGGAPDGITWFNDLDSAVAHATVNRAPVMLMQLLGRLDDEFC
ncbi:MAG: hypothetical protein HYZ53_18105 [Planctomycetes bacterium]|nr:hypothetical protein [Planctomycetota bacterium]